ncbi:MAG: ABC-2 transporter permease [Anaerovoracaceae bacterium]
MKGLILKDLYAMGSFYRNTLFSMIIVCGCFGFSLGAEGVAAATAIMCATMIVSTFTLDERCGWPGFAAALPVARKDSVLAKYAVHVIYCFAGILLGFVISIVVNMFAEQKLSVAELGVCAVVSFAIAMLFGFVIIPIMFRFGAEKARFIMMAVIALPTIAVYLLADKVNLEGMELTDMGIKLMYAAAVLGFILIGLASCAISIKIYSKKEF